MSTSNVPLCQIPLLFSSQEPFRLSHSVNAYNVQSISAAERLGVQPAAPSVLMFTNAQIVDVIAYSSYQIYIKEKLLFINIRYHSKVWDR